MTINLKTEILTAPNNPNDPIPVNQARDMYAACMNTGINQVTLTK